MQPVIRINDSMRMSSCYSKIHFSRNCPLEILAVKPRQLGQRGPSPPTASMYVYSIVDLIIVYDGIYNHYSLIVSRGNLWSSRNRGSFSERIGEKSSDLPGLLGPRAKRHHRGVHDQRGRR
jgi:hypothetical protein